MPSIGSQNAMGGGQYTMGKGVHLPWVGDLI